MNSSRDREFISKTPKTNKLKIQLGVHRNVHSYISNNNKSTSNKFQSISAYSKEKNFIKYDLDQVKTIKIKKKNTAWYGNYLNIASKNVFKLSKPPNITNLIQTHFTSCATETKHKTAARTPDKTTNIKPKLQHHKKQITMKLTRNTIHNKINTYSMNVKKQNNNNNNNISRNDKNMTNNKEDSKTEAKGRNDPIRSSKQYKSVFKTNTRDWNRFKAKDQFNDKDDKLVIKKSISKSYQKFNPLSFEKRMNQSSEAVVLPVKIKVTTVSKRNKSFQKFAPINILRYIKKIYSDRDRNSTNIKDILACSLPGMSAGYNEKINQDAYFFKDIIWNSEHCLVFGICDGHGETGRQCSQFISTQIFEYFKAGTTNVKTSELLFGIYSDLDKQINSLTNFDTKLSGTTCITLISTPDKIICGNIGDSSSILVRLENNDYKITKLSKDHTPKLPCEKDRIERSGGCVHAMYNKESKKYSGPWRVFKKNSMYPGLAVTRSFGDKTAHEVGVISTPEVIEIKYTGNEQYWIVASDGIWEFISSEECSTIINKYYTEDKPIEDGVLNLIKEAQYRWRKNEGWIDDITVIVVYFNN